MKYACRKQNMHIKESENEITYCGIDKRSQYSSDIKAPMWNVNFEDYKKSSWRMTHACPGSADFTHTIYCSKCGTPSIEYLESVLNKAYERLATLIQY